MAEREHRWNNQRKGNNQEGETKMKTVIDLEKEGKSLAYINGFIDGQSEILRDTIREMRKK